MKRTSVIYTVIIVLAVMVLSLCGRSFAADHAEQLPEDQLPAETFSSDQMKPMHFAKLVNSMIKVRISCEPISIRTLAEHQDELQLVKADGELFLKPDHIEYLGYQLNKNSEDKTISFFDLIYDYETRWKELEDAMNLRIGDDGAIQPLTDGNGNPDSCVFRADDGGWVISLYNTQDAEQIAEQYEQEFTGQDILLYLDGVHSLSFDKNTSAMVGSFLDHFDFASLRLFTTFPLDQYEKTNTLLELSTPKGEYVPEAPQLKKLHLVLYRFGNRKLPDFEKLPSLEELDLTVRVSWSDDEKDVFDENTRPVNISPTLKAIRVYPEAGEITGDDPDLRIWLAAQASVSPDLTLNGEPIQNFNLEDGMDDSTISTMNTIRDDGALLTLFQKMADLYISDGKIGEKLIILMVNRSQGFERISTDPSTWKDYTGFPQERLAENVGEADTLLVVYPVYHEAGTYGGLFTAYSCTTMIAAMDLKTEQLILRETVATNAPPETTTLGSGNTSGTYEINKALDKLAEIS